MTSRILVTGGTGTLGRHVVPRLRDAGTAVRVLSRHARETADGVDYVTGDLLKDEGIQAAVNGAGIIVHLAGGRKGDDEATRNLVRAAARAGARHVVYISVVGADRIPVVSGADRAMFGYFGFKLAAERIIADSGLPWTTLRATQFHDLSLTVAEQMTKLPVIPVPAGVRFQPVDTGEGAARLVGLAPASPARRVPDTAGPACSASTCGPAARAGCWCRSGSRARPPARCGPARTWLRTGRWATGPGKTSWPTGCRAAPEQPRGQHPGPGRPPRGSTRRLSHRPGTVPVPHPAAPRPPPAAPVPRPEEPE